MLLQERWLDSHCSLNHYFTIHFHFHKHRQDRLTWSTREHWTELISTTVFTHTDNSSPWLWLFSHDYVHTVNGTTCCKFFEMKLPAQDKEGRKAPVYVLTRNSPFWLRLLSQIGFQLQPSSSLHPEEVNFIWISNHVGKESNELADWAVKEAWEFHLFLTYWSL